MGLFNVLGNIASSAIKVVATPVAIIADVVGDDFEDSLDELFGEKL